MPARLASGVRFDLDPVVAVAGIERQAEAFALLDDGGVPVAVLWIGPAGGAGLGVGIGEEEVVGDILVAVRPLLRQVVGPAEEVEDRPDEVLLGDGLVGLMVLPEGLVGLGEASCRKAASDAADAGHSAVALMPSVRK